MNAAEDYVAGTAAVGEWVDLHVESLFSNWGINALTNASGQWFRDYGAQNYDITEQMWANGWAVDNQGNRSHDHTTGLPGIEASIADDWISGFNFSPDRQVRIRIYSSYGGSLLADVMVNANGNTQLQANYWQHGVDLQPGMYILTEDTETGKYSELTLANLTFDGVDYDTDTAWGKAEPFAHVVVRANHLFDNYEITVIADGSGDWLADFSSYGANINSEWNLRAMIFDLEFDATVAQAPQPPVFTASLDGNWINGNNWTPNNNVSINIYEYEDGPSIGETFTWGTDNYGNFNANLWNEGMDLLPGNYITVTDNFSGVVKGLILFNLTIDYLDSVNDLAGGLAPADTRLSVDFNNQQENIQFDLFSESDGTWEADFGAHDFDLQADSSGNVRISDADGDTIQVDGRVPDPRVIVSLHRNAVIDQEWPENTLLTLSIDDPSNGPGEDYTAQITAGQGETFPYAYLGFALYDAFQIQPGQIVTVSGGGYSVTHIVKDLRITNVDSENDIVSGKCTPGSEVRVTVHGLGQRTVLVDQAGNWSVDFSTPDGEFIYDITPATEMPFHCYDEVSTSGETESMYPVHFTVWVDGGVWGNNWKIGQPVILEIDDPTTQQSPDFSNVGWPEPGPWYYTGVNFSVPPQAIDLQPGFLVTATQGTQVQTHTITDITINEVNVDEDIVSGTANPNAFVLVGVNSGDEGLRLVQADSEGNWTADYKVPGSFPPWQATADIHEDTYVSASEFDDNGNNTSVNWHLANPTFGVRANTDQVEGWEWPLGVTVTVTVDDPETADVAPDITRFVNVYEAPWNPGEYRFDLDLNDVIDIQPGFLITATYGETTKQHTVLNLAFTDIDVDTDVVTGEAAAGSSVDIWTCDENGCYNLDPDLVANENGLWSADFTSIYDIVPGTWIDSSVRDEDGDQTMFGLNVPNPHLTDFPVNDAVAIWEWPDGSTVHLSVDDPSTIQSPDFEQELTIAVTTWGDPRTFARYEFSGEYDLKVGDVVTVTDGITPRTHVVQNLSVTAVNEATETITGEASPGEVVYVWPHEYGQYEVHPTADGGVWLADFTSVGFDLQPGMEGRSEVRDEFGNSTAVDWHAPNPRIRALPVVNEVHGYDWPMGASVQLTIDDDTDPNNGFLYEDTKTVERMDWDWNHTEILFHLWEDDFTLQPSQYITMTDGNTIKTHWVTSLSVTTIDPVADTVSGKAAPGSNVGHWACDENGCANRLVIADENSDWIADFAHVGENDGEQDLLDIRAGVGGDVSQFDDDGDYTEVQWRVPNPNFAVRANFDQVEAYEWNLGTTLTLEIDDPDNGPGVDYDDTQIVGVAPWNPNQTYVEFRFAGEYDLQPGDEVSLTDGFTTKTHTVTSLEITAFDVENDLVYGVAEPGSYINFVYACDNGNCSSTRHVHADSEGKWIADFGNPGDEDDEQDTYDIVGGNWVDAQQGDDDGDFTFFGETVSNLLTLKGFYQPVDMNGVYNLVKGGSTVPLKFEIFAGSTELTDIADIKSLTYAQTSCDANAITDEIETTATGGTSLRYDVAAGQFIYNWKTPKSAGVCYRVTMTTIDNSTLVAYFKLK